MKRGQTVGVEQLCGLRMFAIQITEFSPGATYFCSGTFQHFFVSAIFPKHEIFKNFEEALTFRCSFLLVLAIFEAASLLITWIIYELSEDYRPRRCKRAPSPP